MRLACVFFYAYILLVWNVYCTLQVRYVDRKDKVQLEQLQDALALLSYDDPGASPVGSILHESTRQASDRAANQMKKRLMLFSPRISESNFLSSVFVRTSLND